MGDGSGERKEGEVDVGALLRASLDRPAPPDMADRVMSRLAFAETVLELGRLLGIAPMSVAADAVRRDDEEDDEGGGESSADEDDDA